AYDTNLERESWRLFGKGDLPFSRERMAYFLRAYAPDADALSDPLFAPIHADVHGLPPAFLAVGSHDGLRDDSVVMAAHLLDGGVKATLEIYPGAVHGFAEAATASGAAVAKRMLADC